MSRLPTLFVSHGAPNLILHNTQAKLFLERFGAELPRPKAILVASAHFDTPVPMATADARPRTVYDFGGFEPELRQIHLYPAPGDPQLAERATALLGAAGLGAKTASRTRLTTTAPGVPLALPLPGSRHSVVQLSIQSKPRTGAPSEGRGGAGASRRGGRADRRIGAPPDP
jgi:4,5-DOPA dioxygenase extradiol